MSSCREQKVLFSLVSFRNVFALIQKNVLENAELPRTASGIHDFDMNFRDSTKIVFKNINLVPTWIHLIQEDESCSKMHESCFIRVFTEVKKGSCKECYCTWPKVQPEFIETWGLDSLYKTVQAISQFYKHTKMGRPLQFDKRTNITETCGGLHSFTVEASTILQTHKYMYI